MKKRGFGAGKWNGVGGKVKGDESVIQASTRELNEEIGVIGSENDFKKMGVLRFYFNGKPDWNQEMHIFTLQSWKGEPGESEEMLPQWYRYAEIPFEKMWIDDPYWLPAVLKGKAVEGEFYFNGDGSKIEKFGLKEV